MDIQPEKRKYESARQIQRQSDILASARQMLSDVGYSGMTMRGLADKAGVAPATLYNLYGGKDELIMSNDSQVLDEIQIKRLLREPPCYVEHPQLKSVELAADGRFVNNP